MEKVHMGVSFLEKKLIGQVGSSDFNEIIISQYV